MRSRSPARRPRACSTISSYKPALVVESGALAANIATSIIALRSLYAQPASAAAGILRPAGESAMTLTTTEDDNGFRIRGSQPTRVDAFVDAAFAFAVTLLVIAIGHVPNSV